MKRPTTTRDDIGSLLPAANYAKSKRALGAVLSRAEEKARTYERMIDWPRLHAHVRGEADEIEAMFRGYGRAP